MNLFKISPPLHRSITLPQGGLFYVVKSVVIWKDPAENAPFRNLRPAVPDIA
jgi:hypothetical protein